MKLPFNFTEFVKNPFAAIALLCIVGMGYLYMDARNAQQTILDECKINKTEIKKDLAKAEKQRDKWMDKVEDLLTDLEKLQKP